MVEKYINNHAQLQTMFSMSEGIMCGKPRINEDLYMRDPWTHIAVQRS